MTAEYEFVRPKSVIGNVRDIAVDQLQQAHESLTTTKQLEKGIYAARKSTKRLRALLRLVRTVLPAGVFERENGAYRDVANALGSLRDAWVRLEILDTLADEVQQTESFQQLRAIFQTEYDALAEEFLHRERFEGVIGQIMEATERAAVLDVRDNDYATLRENLYKTIRSGRRAFEHVETEFSDVNLHEWRKHIKRLWYHLTLLRPAAPDLLDEWITLLDELGDTLGKAHDWALLAHLGQERLGDDDRHEPLWKAMAHHQHTAEKHVMAAGKALYKRLRPRRLLGLLGARYDAWQIGF